VVTNEIINEKYIKCLSCGNTFQNPFKSQQPNNKKRRNWIIAIVVFVVLCIIGNHNNNGGNSANGGNAKYEIYYMAKKYVKNQLKAPSSAKFPSFNDISVVDLGNNVYKVDAYVDAQNSFGTMVRSYYTITASNNSYTWTVQSFIFDGKIIF
jgi:hypothetical protein